PLATPANAARKNRSHRRKRNRMASFLVSATSPRGRGESRRGENNEKSAFCTPLFAIPVRPVFAQDSLEGLWQGYDGEWRHVSSQLIALAEATPEEKFGWRPAPGVRSTSEGYTHTAVANLSLLSGTGPTMPATRNERRG